MSKPKITLDLDKDRWTGQFQLSINKRDENGSGDGYRLLGPKYNGSSRTLQSVTLSARDRDEIRAYLDLIEDETP
jgi:hypothetical protein